LEDRVTRSDLRLKLALDIFFEGDLYLDQLRGFKQWERIAPQTEKLVVVLLQNRYKYIPDEITITFSPGYKIKWGRGDAAIRKLTKKKSESKISCKCWLGINNHAHA
jgi:hypothetical protein